MGVILAALVGPRWCSGYAFRYSVMDNQEYYLLLGDNSGTLMPWSAKSRRRIHPGGEGDEIGMRCPLGL